MNVVYQVFTTIRGRDFRGTPKSANVNREFIAFRSISQVKFK